MKSVFFSICLLVSLQLAAQITPVNSQSTFNEALNDANTGDIIEWENGDYTDIFMNIDVEGVIIRAETPGEVIFSGASRLVINADDITFTGFQYIGGDIGTSDVARIFGSNVLFEEVNISEYTCNKYLIIEDESQFTTVRNCNFENRLNAPDENILSILVAENQPGFHTIQYCSFKNFSTTPGASVGDAGVEPIRIGLSTTSEYTSNSIVEYCYFNDCDGDGEIISHKATNCVYRFNTFEGNPNAELVLRHGDRGIVYSNFFYNNRGGIRVREGSDHIIFNNYFNDLADRSIYLQAESDDRVENVTIAFNTFVNSSSVRLGDDESDDPLNTNLLNNIFDNTTSTNHFTDATGTETWLGNIIDNASDLGISPAPSSGITFTDPRLAINTQGFYELSSNSPAIDAAVDNSATFPFPQINGLVYDTTIGMDLISNMRDMPINLKDVGAQEYNASAEVAPYVTADNTGPSYLRPDDGTLSLNTFEIELGGDIKTSPNPMIDESLNLVANFSRSADVKIELLSLQGKNLGTIFEGKVEAGAQHISKAMTFTKGIYLLRINALNNKGEVMATKTEKLLKW